MTTERRVYGRTNRAEDVARCIERVQDSMGWGFNQCRRARGHGPEGAYCKQHDPVARKAKGDAKYADYAAARELERRHRTANADTVAYVRELAANGDVRAIGIVTRLDA